MAPLRRKAENRVKFGAERKSQLVRRGHKEKRPG